MTHPLYEIIQHQIDTEIYDVLFGMSKNDMIRAAYLKHPEGWGEIWGDDDTENMRDCLSAEALELLATVESECATAILEGILKKGKPGVKQLKKLCREIAMKHKPETINVWWISSTQEAT